MDQLAAGCASDGGYKGFFVSPLKVSGGSGSPPNAFAIK
jgi:hypothetical protein